MQYRIVITSSKGGVGKSTTAAMLAQALAERGKRVLLLDLDLGNRCLDMFFGLENDIVCDFGVVYDDPGTACRAVKKLDVSAPGVLSFCASSASLIPSEVIGDKLVRTVELLGDIAGADYVICDTAGTVIPEKLAKWANLGLICSSQMPASVRSAATTAGRLREAGLEELRLVITSFEYKEAKDRTRAGLLEMIDNSGIRAVGVIPLDRRMFLMQEEGKLPDAKSPARRAYANIAARLCGEERKLFDGIRRMNGKSVL